MVIKAVGKVSKRTGQGRGARTRSHAMRVFAVGQSEEKRNAAENKRQAEGCNKKKKKVTEEFVIAKSSLQTQNVKFQLCLDSE